MELQENRCLLAIIVFCSFSCIQVSEGQEERKLTDHWAFRPIMRPVVPEDANDDPVSWFISRRLEAEKLILSPSAKRRDWMRRLYYNLIGLPPSYAQLDAFCADPRSDFELVRELVNELLGSPEYGEHWSRLWLDVARYSDTKGYAYSPEEFNFPHAWLYRDWVVNAFNRDLPYDKFVLLQLASDLMLSEGLCDRSDLAAMGFLTLGRRFISVEPDIIDDRIDVTTRGLMGLTVSCARCHDHKFDPVSSADYYALYGVFKSSREELVPIDMIAARAASELEKKKASLAQEFEKQATELETRFLSRVSEYMTSSLNIAEVPPPDFAEIIEKGDLNPAQIRRWYEYLTQESRKTDPVFIPWLALAKADQESFPEAAVEILDQVRGANGLVISALRNVPLLSMADVAQRYAKLFQETATNPPETEQGKQLHDVVYGEGSPVRVPRKYIHDVEWLFDEKTKEAIKKQLAEVEREILKLGEKAPHSLILVDRPVPLNVNVFNRGNYPDQGAHIRRGYLSVFSKENRKEFGIGSGRLDLARNIVSKDNPLTARVIVNRIWRAHFGEGITRTVSDFGFRSDAPSHPGLLDFLASELIESNWSIKHVQRLIATSAVCRVRVGALPSKDPQNHLLSTYPRRRLNFESMRDTMLFASGELDLRRGGPPGELFGKNASKRRSIYGRIDRQYLPSTLRIFDFANPELHTPRRYQTNVPQQALFLMNSEFAVGRSKALAARVKGELPTANKESKVLRFFEYVYGRRPSQEELVQSLQFISDRPQAASDSDTFKEAWSYGYGNFDQESGRVVQYNGLPYFDGAAWGGGPDWPDSSLGWIRLTAEGGHVGNDVNHAAVRRWESPFSGTIEITGSISKVESCGDGLRAWVSSSRQGLIEEWKIEFDKKQPTNVVAVNVEVGEILDFVVDCGEKDDFFCDGFAWAPVLKSKANQQTWSAANHFGGKDQAVIGLDVWQRFAQALLISNEVMFLD